MAQVWTPKAPTEVVERTWAVPLAYDDAILTVSTSASGVTVDSDDYRLGEAVVVLSAGTAGATGNVTVTVTTDAGHTHVETFYIAIQAATVQAVTARDMANFALRKIAGMGEDATATELDDAIELLSGLLAKHRIGPVPLEAGTAMNLPDDLIQPFKFMLRRLVHSSYEAPLTAADERMADEGERYVTNSLFEQRDLAMPWTLARTVETVWDA